MNIKLFPVIFLIIGLFLDVDMIVYADEPINDSNYLIDQSHQQGNEQVSTNSADQLPIDLVLTGTIVQNNPMYSIAQLFVEGQDFEQSYLAGDEIFDGVVLLNVNKESILLEHQDQKYWLVINSSTNSDIMTYATYDIVSSSDRYDSPEFYNEDGILMEGAAALKYGVDLNATPVIEQTDMDTRLENLPNDVILRNGIPNTWWNPQNLTHLSKPAMSLNNHSKPQ